MKLADRQLTRGVLITGLSAITMMEAIWPGVIGAATNLGVVVFLSGLGLFISLKNL